jgi:amino acid efflux transporter
MADLERRLGALRAASVMLNIVLGAGLLTLPGLAVGTVGSWALIVWAICAVAAAPLLAVFAVLGRRYPDAGGLAHIAKAAFGDTGYVVATLLFLGAVALGLPAIALTGGHYASALFSGAPHGWAVALLILATLANAISTEAAARFNTGVAGVLVFALIAIAAIGLGLSWSNLSGIAMPSDDWIGLRPFGAAVMMVFFAFTGWEVAASLGGEVRQPSRNIPIAMALSFGVAVALYGALAVVAVATDLDGNYEAPFAALLGDAFGTIGVAAISLLAVLLIFANLSAAIWAVSRMVWSAAGERLLPAALRPVRRGVPIAAVLTTVSVLIGVTALSWTGSVRLDALFAAAGQNFVLIYGLAAGALFMLARHPSERVLAVLCLVIVVLLVGLRGGQGAAYPALLVVLGAATARIRQGRSAARDRA